MVKNRKLPGFAPGPRSPDILGRGWPGPVLRLTQAESTQDIGKNMAQEGSPEWTLILAERQTRGRGRMERQWTSPKGGLYFSVIMRPRVSPKQLGELSLLAAE